MIYVYFKSLLRKIQGYKPPKDRSFTEKQRCISRAGSLTKSSEATKTFGAGSIPRGRRFIRLARKHPGRKKEDAGVNGEEKAVSDEA